MLNPYQCQKLHGFMKVIKKGDTSSLINPVGLSKIGSVNDTGASKQLYWSHVKEEQTSMRTTSNWWNSKGVFKTNHTSDWFHWECTWWGRWNAKATQSRAQIGEWVNYRTMMIQRRRRKLWQKMMNHIISRVLLRFTLSYRHHLLRSITTKI